MSNENISMESTPTRRTILKKAGIASAFVIPTVTTFTIADLAQACSPAGGHNHNHNHGGNG